MALPPHLQELARRVSNWGRWGDDDRRGTLNLADAAAALRGAAEVRDGRVFTLAIPFDEQGPQWDRESMPERVNPELHPYMVNVSFTGDRSDFTTTDDSFRMGSQAATHWDALAHVGYEELLWNGISDATNTADGATALGIEHFGPLVTRGVLLDVARLHGVEHFDDNHPIGPDDLDGALAATGVDLAPGDAVLVRTGQFAHLRAGDRRRYSMPSPGLNVASVEWFARRDVAAVATDTMTFECYPCEDPQVFFPVHMLNLRDVGLAQGQNWDLDALAADCATDGRYGFLLCAAPLPLTGGAGAPVVPTAVK